MPKSLLRQQKLAKEWEEQRKKTHPKIIMKKMRRKINPYWEMMRSRTKQNLEVKMDPDESAMKMLMEK